MADADCAPEPFAIERCGQVDQFPGRAAAIDVAVHQRGDAGAVIAAVFQAAQRFQKKGSCWPLSDNAHDAAHALFPSFRLIFDIITI